MTTQNFLRPPTRRELLEAHEVALELRAVAVLGSTEGLVLHHLANAIGGQSNDAWAPIVMRAMVEQAREILRSHG